MVNSWFCESMVIGEMDQVWCRALSRILQMACFYWTASSSTWVDGHWSTWEMIMWVREPGKSNYCSDWSECIRLFGSFVLIADLMTRCLDWFGYLRWCALLFPKIVWKWIVECMAHFGDKVSSSLMLTFRQLTIWGHIWSCGLNWLRQKFVVVSYVGLVVICWMDMRALVNSGEIVEQLHNC